MCKWKGQEFPDKETQWKKNDLTGELEELPDKLDIVEFVNSFKETAFSEVLDKYLDFAKSKSLYEALPKAENGEIDMSIVQDDLTALQSMSTEVDAIKQDYDLPDDWSIKQIYDYINTKLKNKVVKKVEDKEEKETVEEVKPQDVPQTGEESA